MAKIQVMGEKNRASKELISSTDQSTGQFLTLSSEWWENCSPGLAGARGPHMSTHVHVGVITLWFRDCGFPLSSVCTHGLEGPVALLLQRSSSHNLHTQKVSFDELC